jgi:hypothetical protein
MNSLSLGGAKNIGYDNSETPADWEGEAQERQREREIRTSREYYELS